VKTFEREWNAWAANCISKEESPANRDTLRIAFYSGAMTWERLMLRIRLSKNHAAAANQVVDLHKEMQAYVNELIGKFGPPPAKASSNGLSHPDQGEEE
jgi:hypothetical protein